MAHIHVLDRPFLQALLPALNAARASFDEARSARDPRRAAGLALAARLEGHPFRLTAADLDWLLPRLLDPVLLPCLVGCCEEPGLDVLLRLLARKPLAVTRSSALLTAAVGLAGATPPEPLLEEARRAARGDSFRISAAATCALLGIRNDWEEPARALADRFRRYLEGDFEDTLLEYAVPGETRRRATPKVGRNDLCPCGSGKKSKKCCEGRTVEYVERREGAVRGRPLHELVALDPDGLATGELKALIQTLGCYGLLDDAEAAFESLARRTDLGEPLDNLRYSLLLDAADRRDFAVIRRQLQASSEDHPLGRCAPGLLAALDERMDPLEACCREILVDRELELDFSCLLADLRPALGVLFARAALGADAGADGPDLFEEIRRARRQLDLPPTDRFEELWKARSAEKDGAEEARLLRARLAAAAEQKRELERRLKELERLPAREGPGPTGDPVEVRRLRERVSTLQQMVAERNEERARLRKQLRTQVRPEPAPAVTVAERRETAPQARRPPLVPRLSSEAEEDLRALPDAPSRVALKQLGALCAGDDLAWSKVKRLHTVEGLFSVRLGLHHRMLFGCDLERRTLEVRRLIPRGSQARVLRLLRAA